MVAADDVAVELVGDELALPAVEETNGTGLVEEDLLILEEGRALDDWQDLKSETAFRSMEAKISSSISASHRMDCRPMIARTKSNRIVIWNSISSSQPRGGREAIIARSLLEFSSCW